MPASPTRTYPPTSTLERGVPDTTAGWADLAMLPLRLGRATVDVVFGLATLSAPEGPIRRRGGYAERTMAVIGENGLLEQLTRVVTDPEGPLRLANLVGDLTAADRPIGRFLSREGILDKLLAEDGAIYRLLKPGGMIDQLTADGGSLERLLERGGAVDRLLADDGPLDRLLVDDGALDRITEPGGLLDQVLRPGGLAERLLLDEGFLDKLTREGGTLDQLVDLGERIEQVSPQLDRIAQLIPDLHEAVEVLNRSVGPLGDLANRLPGGRKRPQAVGD